MRIREAVWLTACLGILSLAVTGFLFAFVDGRFLYAIVGCYLVTGSILQRLEAVALEFDPQPQNGSGLMDVQNHPIANVSLKWRLSVILFWSPWFLIGRVIPLILFVPFTMWDFYRWGFLGHKDSNVSEARKFLLTQIAFPRVFRDPCEHKTWRQEGWTKVESTYGIPEKGGTLGVGIRVGWTEAPQPKPEAKEQVQADQKALPTSPIITFSRNGHGGPEAKAALEQSDELVGSSPKR